MPRAVRELVRRDKERRLCDLEPRLVAAAKRLKVELTVSDIRRKRLLRALRERALER